MNYLPHPYRAATLRNVAEKGWSAKGLLQPLWVEYPGGRDGLAEKLGMDGGTLSSLNTGKINLGPKRGRRLAEELGVSLVELGSPGEGEDERGRAIARRLAEAEAALNVLAPLVERLEARVAVLEKRSRPSRRTGESRR